MKNTEEEKLFAAKNFHGSSVKCFNNVIALDYAFEHVLTLTLSHCWPTTRLRVHARRSLAKFVFMDRAQSELFKSATTMLKFDRGAEL